MDKKFVLRLKNADLFDLEQTRLEKAAAEGWLPYSMSRRIFTLKRGEPQDIKCRLLFYDVADPSYNARMTELQGKGWTYVSSDGISQTLLTAPSGSDASLVICPGEKLIYTTNAYSLLPDAQ